MQTQQWHRYKKIQKSTVFLYLSTEHLDTKYKNIIQALEKKLI